MNTLAWAALGVAVGTGAAAWLLVGGDQPAAPPRVTTAEIRRLPQLPPPHRSPTAVAAAATSAPRAPLAPASQVGIIVLSGVAGGPGRQALALVSAGRGPQRVLRVGDPVGGQAKVLRIDADSMTYGSPGQEVRLFITPGTVAPVAAVHVDPPIAGVPLPGGRRLAAQAPAPAPAPAGEAEPGRGNEGFRSTFERKRLAIQASR